MIQRECGWEKSCLGAHKILLIFIPVHGGCEDILTYVPAVYQKGEVTSPLQTAKPYLLKSFFVSSSDRKGIPVYLDSLSVRSERSLEQLVSRKRGGRAMSKDY